MNTPMTTDPDRRARRRGCLVAATAALAVVTVVGVTRSSAGHPAGAAVASATATSAPVATPGNLTPTQNVTPTATAPPPTVQYPGQAPPARRFLQVLADAVRSGPDDPPATGRYVHVYVRLWAADDTLHPGGGRETTIVTYEQRRWRAWDGSGRVTTIRPPGEDHGPPPGTTDHPPGSLRGVLPEPLSADPAVLAGQFNDIHPWVNGPQSRLRAVADVYAWHHPGRDVRAALLQVLCDTDRLLWRRHTIDRAGRPGAAVSVDHDGIRDTVTFDPRTGRMLAHQTIRLTGPSPRLVGYLLVLDAGRVAHPA